jgi:menaquinone-dependent protoporphyrinogen oxidase
MKTLILYATKHGAAKEIAERIATRIEGSMVYDLKQENIPSLADFECVIIGSSVYAGSIRKEAKTYLTKNLCCLPDKVLGLFLSGMSENDVSDVFKSNFPAEIVEKAKVKALLGGIFDPKNSSIMAKFIMKIATKQSGYVNTISDDKIDVFIKDLIT